MKFLFISFQENSDVIGLKYLHAWLMQHGHESRVLLIPKASAENLDAGLAEVLRFMPAIVGIGAMTYEFKTATEFARRLRTNFSGLIIFGGPHPTLDPASCFPAADVVVMGEAEQTLLELIAAYERGGLPALEPVPGLCISKAGRPFTTPVRAACTDLDALPFPGHTPAGFFVIHNGQVRPLSEPAVFRRYARYRGTFLSVISSRGCPFHCTYCGNSVFGGLQTGPRVRRRSFENVVAEVAAEVAAHPDILYVNFQDDCFLAHSREWLTGFAREYARLGVPFIARAVPRQFAPEKLALLKPAGLRWAFMGIQTGSDRVNREVYDRRVTAAEVREAAGHIHAAGLSAWYDIILDNPYESDADNLATVDLLLDLPRPFQLDLFSLDFFPGTPLRARALADGIPVPEPGAKHYTQPEAKSINRLIRMTASLPRAWVRAIRRRYPSTLARLLLEPAYALTLFIEPFVYLRLIANADDHSPLRTLRVLRAFSATAFAKLFLRTLG